MNRSWFPILAVILLLGLLSLLATLQYRWVGQISESEKQQMQKRLTSDTERFAEDFNRDIQAAYFPFQFYTDDWEKDFTAHYRSWRERADYPALIKDFYFLPPQGETKRYDFALAEFVKADSEESFAQVKADFVPIDEKKLVLRMPVYKQTEKLIETKRIETTSTLESPAPVLTRESVIPEKINLPELNGYLLIKLDENVIKEKLLANLNEKYFAGGDYKISVVNPADGTAIFQTETVETVDSSARLFALTPDNLAFFVNQDLQSSLDKFSTKSQYFFNRNVEGRLMKVTREKFDGNVQVRLQGKDSPPKILQMSKTENGGIWTLNVRHSAGSLEDFVARSRRKNLAASFGILFLLGASIILIFVSAQRARRLAQKQVDFVSAVSHEFRTPLAVIYSAGENLTDGVVNSEVQIAKYGNLIKREGKKLSAMVEQILEFAGARSGRKKYDFREVAVESVIENALCACQSLIEEKDFTVEKEIAADLPNVTADAAALSQTLQNLIANSIKYGNGVSWLKISATNGERRVKISIEDKGIGISKKDISQIFQPFYRSKSVVDAQIHGNGLGLSLVEQTIEAHGGKVSVESELGRGSKFTIHLPASI